MLLVDLSHSPKNGLKIPLHPQCFYNECIDSSCDHQRNSSRGLTGCFYLVS